MKIKEGFIIRELGDKYIIIPKASSNLDFTSMITLNLTAKVLFESLEEERSLEELIEILLNKFDVSFTQAEKDVIAFINKLQESGLLEDE